MMSTGILPWEDTKEISKKYADTVVEFGFVYQFFACLKTHFHTETVFLMVSEAIERSIKRKVKYNLKQISIYKLLSSKDRDARIPP